MKHYARYILILPPLLVCAAAICLCHSSGDDMFPEIPAATENERLQWLISQGLQAEPVSSQAVTVPLDFSGSYADYAALQVQQHLPLTRFAGTNAMLLTYEVQDSEPLMYAELLTADGLLIGAQCYCPEEGTILDMKGRPFSAPTDPAA